MYFPYFRGKQFELLAIKEMASIISPQNVCPIIEPVKLNFNPLKVACDSLIKSETNFCVIINPQHGELKNNADLLVDFLQRVYGNTPLLKYGYIINNETDIDSVRSFVNQYSTNNKLFVHYGFQDSNMLAHLLSGEDNIYAHVFETNSVSKIYRKKFRNNRSNALMIQLEDSFHKQKNANYPPDEAFSDQHLTYEEENLNGFGDFLIVGNEFSESGGPAFAVAIHLTYINYNQDEELRIYHFVSDSVATSQDPAGKFLEALVKLIKRIRNDTTNNFKTKACLELRDLYTNSHYPGLGYLKKLSMLHHIELIDKYLL